MKYALFAALLLCAFAVTASAQQSAAAPTDFLSRHNIKSVSILPPVGESVPASVRDAMGAALLDELKKAFTGVTFVGPAESTNLLSDGKGLDDFTSFLTLFVKTGAVNKEALGRVGGTLKTDALLLVDIQAYESQNGSWMRARNGHNSVRAQYTLLTPAGERLWQHLLNYVHTPIWTAKADRAEKVSVRVARRAASALSRGVENSDPKRDVEVP